MLILSEVRKAQRSHLTRLHRPGKRATHIRPPRADMTPTTSPLTTDLYELNMIQAYLDRGENKTAVFEFFVRRLPARRNFLLAAGLGDTISYLETLRFSGDEIDWLKSKRRFRDKLIDYLVVFLITSDDHSYKVG